MTIFEILFRKNFKNENFHAHNQSGKFFKFLLLNNFDTQALKLVPV